MADTYSLVALMEETNKILGDLEPGEVDGAINWGDLGCMDALHQENVHGESNYRVIIQEASPDAYHLQEYVAKTLAERGFINVEVDTEW